MSGPFVECLQGLVEIYGKEKSNPAVTRLSHLVKTVLADESFATGAIFDFSLCDQKTYQPLTDVQLVTSKKPKDVPEGYELISKSVSGKHTGNLNTNGKEVYMAVQRGQEEKKVVTSLAIALPSLGEEAYYGFTRQDIDINRGTKTGNVVNLCTLRGSGAPVVDVVLVHAKEELPVDYKRISVTPFGHKANVNNSHVKSKADQGLYLAFKVEITSLLARFRVTPSSSSSSPSENGNPKSSSSDVVTAAETCMAALVASLFVASQETAIAALMLFQKISPSAVPPALMNTFMCTLCDCVPGFLTYFSTDKGLAFLVHFLGFCVRKYVAALNTATIVRVMEVCFLIRHEDKQTNASMGLVSSLCKNVDACGLCPNCDGRNAGKIAKKSTLSGQPCVKCRQNALVPAETEGKGKPADVISKAVILQTLQQLSIAKALDPAVNKFHKHVNAGPLFGEHVDKLTTYLASCHSWYTQEELTGAPGQPPKLPTQKWNALVGVILTCCKFATEESTVLQKKSETLKRKLHALTVLLHIVRSCGSFFRSTPGTIMLLRRFVMGSLMQALKAPHSPTWRMVLQIYSALRSSCEDLIMIEQGLLIENILLPALDSELTPVQVKKDIMDIFSSIFTAPEDVISIYYNYDNHGKAWPIFSRIIDTVSRIVEGDVKAVDDKQATPRQEPNGGAAVSNAEADKLRALSQSNGNRNSVGSSSSFSSSSSSSSAVGNDTDDVKSPETEYEEFRMQCTRLLVTVVQHLAKWIGAYGMGGGRVSVIDMRLVNSNLDMHGQKSKSKTEKKIARTNTWSFRYDQQKMDQKVIDKALYLARTESLKNALKYLKAVSPSSTVPMEVAKFLHEHAHQLDPVQMGDVLGDLEDSWMDQADYSQLRVAFVTLMDFSKMTLDQAMRLFLVESGFRMPGEAQKIDRLMEVLCMAYCRDNPDAYEGGIDAAQTLAFAMIMLNTDLHDPRLQAARKRNGRKPMSKAEFVRNLRGCNARGDFDPDMLSVVYDGVFNHPILWVEKSEREAKKQAVKSQEEVAAECKAMYAKLVRKCNAEMRGYAAYQQGKNETESKSIVNGIFEQNWFRLISAFRGMSHFHQDASSLCACIDGYVFGCLIAITLGLRTERQAFAEQLAVVTYEANAVGNSASDVRKRKQGFARGEHLNQEWHKPLNVMAEKQPRQACARLVEVGQEYKMKIAFDRKQAKLEQLQQTFGNDIRLVSPTRHFVMQGPLVKLNNGGGKQMYKVCLFNDLLLYANGSKVHRVLHLSLCRLVDLRSVPLAFRIESAQKSVTFVAKSQKQKDLWLRKILSSLKAVIEARKAYLENLKGKAAAHESSNSNDDFAEFRRISSFVGFSDAKTKANHKANNECKLCIRPFGVFRRKVKCVVCTDAICGDCYKNKCKITANAVNAKNVCDSCYGAIMGFLHADEQMSIRVEGEARPSVAAAENPLKVHAIEEEESTSPVPEQREERKSELVIHS